MRARSLAPRKVVSSAIAILLCPFVTFVMGVAKSDRCAPRSGACEPAAFGSLNLEHEASRVPWPSTQVNRWRIAARHVRPVQFLRAPTQKLPVGCQDDLQAGISS